MALAQASWDDTQPTQNDLDEIRAIVLAAGSSFYWAMRFQDRRKREALFAVYAFCREVDDIADGNLDDNAKRAALQTWRQKIEALYNGQPADAITRVLTDALVTYGLEKKDFLAVIDGMEMDGVGPIRAPSMEDLLLYCDRVACAVGRLCVRVFGEPGPNGQATADHLGLALQLTNILRDIEEDAEMGRLYLPRELLSDAGIESTDPTEVATDPRLPRVCQVLATHAQEEYAAAEASIAASNKHAMRPAIIMMKVYHKTLVRLIADDWIPPHTKPQPSRLQKMGRKLEKLWIALRYGLF